MPLRAAGNVRPQMDGRRRRKQREGTIINVAGMIAFSGSAPLAQLPLRRTVYAGAPGYLVTMTQALHEEIKPDGLRAQVVCPSVVATEFHERQGMDLSARTPHVRAGCRHRQPARSGAR